jgi:hypothetical protein
VYTPLKEPEKPLSPKGSKMSDPKILELTKMYSPTMDKMISLHELVKETGIQVRKIRYNSAHDLIRKTTRVGRESYFGRDYIFFALDCIGVFEKVFKLPLRKMRTIMVANDSSMERLHKVIKVFLEKYPPSGDRPAYYYLIEKKFFDKLAAGDLNIDIASLDNEARRESDRRK